MRLISAFRLPPYGKYSAERRGLVTYRTSPVAVIVLSRQSNGRNPSRALHLRALSTPSASRGCHHAYCGWSDAKTPFGPCRPSLRSDASSTSSLQAESAKQRSQSLWRTNCSPVLKAPYSLLTSAY